MRINSKPAAEIVFVGSYDNRADALTAMVRLARTMLRERRNLQREDRSAPRMTLRIRPVQGVWWLEMIKR